MKIPKWLPDHNGPTRPDGGSADPTGDVDPLRAESISAELEELPLPCRFEVQAMDQIQHRPLLEHIHRVGITIYPAA